MNAIFATFAMVHLALLVAVLAGGRRVRSVGTAIVPVVLAALAYDNLVVALGTTIGEGSVLEALNQVRFAIHVLLTPLLVVVAACLAAAAGIGRARGLLSGAIPLSLALVVVGIVQDGLVASVVPERVEGVLRYVHVDPAPPVAAIVTVLVLMAAGIALWRRGVTIWLGAGSLAMFLASAARPGSLPLLGNLGEAVLLAGIVAASLDIVRATPAGAHAAGPLSDELSLGAP